MHDFGSVFRACNKLEYNHSGWDGLLEDVVGLLRGTHAKFGCWYEKFTTEGDSPFDYWAEWYKIEGNGYAKVKYQEETYETKQNPFQDKMQRMKEWCRLSLVEREHAESMLWIKLTDNMEIYEYFKCHLEVKHQAGGYLDPSVR